MKKVRLIIALALAAALCCAAFAGCTKDKPDPGGEITSAADERASSTDAEPTAIEDDSFYPVDFIGKTVREASEIGEVVSYYNPCADGGALRECSGKLRGVAFSSHTTAEDEASAVKTVYVPLADAGVTRKVTTGKTYEEYKSDIPSLSKLQYNENVYSYSCTCQEKSGNIPVTVWLFFDSPESQCTGAIVTSETFASPKGDAQAPGEDFALRYIGKRTSLAAEKYGKSIMMESDPADRTVIYFTGEQPQQAVDADANAVVKAVSVRSSGVELLPGLQSGESYDDIIANGFGFFGPKTVSEVTGENMCTFTVRVGAANVESFIEFDSDGVMTYSSFVCKPLTD